MLAEQVLSLWGLLGWFRLVVGLVQGLRDRFWLGLLVAVGLGRLGCRARWFSFFGQVSWFAWCGC